MYIKIFKNLNKIFALLYMELKLSLNQLGQDFYVISIRDKISIRDCRSLTWYVLCSI